MPELLTDALAVHRLVRLAQEDRIFDRPRAALLGRVVVEHPRLAELFGCPWCLSVWVAAGVILARRAFPRAWAPVAEILAAADIAGHLSELSRH